MYCLVTPYKNNLVLREFTFNNLIKLTKLCNFSTNEYVCDFFDNFIIESYKYNVIEKCYALIKLYELCVSDTLDLVTETHNVTINADLLLKSIFNLGEINAKYKIMDDGITYIFDLPHSFILKPADIYTHTIQSIILSSGETIDLNDITHTERETIINQLPAKAYNVIVKYAEEQLMKYEAVLINPTTSLGGNPFTINFLSPQAFLFLKGMYSGYSLDYFYELIYTLSRKLNSNFIIERPFKELLVYSRLYTDEMKEENSALQIPSNN